MKKAALLRTSAFDKLRGYLPWKQGGTDPNSRRQLTHRVVEIHNVALNPFKRKVFKMNHYFEETFKAQHISKPLRIWKHLRSLTLLFKLHWLCSNVGLENLLNLHHYRSATCHLNLPHFRLITHNRAPYVWILVLNFWFSTVHWAQKPVQMFLYDFVNCEVAPIDEAPGPW